MKKTTFQNLAFGLLLCFFNAAAFSDEPIERDAKGERIWKLNSYIHGTRFQIRDQLHGEVERITAELQEKNARIAFLKTDEQRNEADFLAGMVNYQKVTKQVADAKTKLDQGRMDHNSRAIVEETSRYNRLSHLLEKLAAAARPEMLKDEYIAQDLKLIETAQQDIARLTESKEKAEKWRDTLQDAIRNTFVISWPLGKGEVGIMGAMTPERVDEEGQLWVSYDVCEWRDEKRNAEGISTFDTVRHPAAVCLLGVNPNSFKKGIKTTFDKTIEVVGTGHLDDGGLVAVFRLKRSEVDDLFEAVDNDMKH
jgi:hypothetical protein